MALRGVNLGGWLVLEKWMTPELFDGTVAVDHYTFMQTPGAREKLAHFQKSFIREEDFRWMQSNGVQAVRIPVGYWILEGDGPYVPCIERLDWAFQMADRYDIEVLICLHGAPGSQNGQDHSGRAGTLAWYESDVHHQRTIDVLVRLARRYRDHPKFWGLELLNEPRIRFSQRRLRRFYQAAYEALTMVLLPSTRVIYSDAFTPRLMNNTLHGSNRHPVSMDIHWYHFTFFLHRYVPIWLYYHLVTAHGRLLRRLTHAQPIVIGEWSGIISGERLNRYPESEHTRICAEHARRQLAAYQGAQAWFYWNYKTQEPGVWNFRSCVEDGFIVLDS